MKPTPLAEAAELARQLGYPATLDGTLAALEWYADTLRDTLDAPEVAPMRAAVAAAIAAAHSHHTGRTEALPSTHTSSVQHRGYLSRGTEADAYEILRGAPNGAPESLKARMREQRAASHEASAAARAAGRMTAKQLRNQARNNRR